MIFIGADWSEILAWNLRTAAALWLAWAGGACSAIHDQMHRAGMVERGDDGQVVVERYEWAIPKDEREPKRHLMLVD